MDGRVVRTTGDGLLQVFKAFRRLLQKRLNIGRDRLVAFTQQGTSRQPGDRGQPFFELVVKPVLRLIGLQIQKAQHQGAAKPEQGG